MPRVPVYEQQTNGVAKMPTPNVARPDADSFGGPIVQGVEKVAQSTAHVVGEYAKQEQDQVDKARVFDAYQQIGQWKASNLYDTEKGYLNKQGETALADPKTGKPLSSVLLEDFDKFTANVERNASTDTQREAIRQMRAHERDGVYRELVGHESRQSDAVKLEKYQAGQDTAVSNAANGYFDPVTGGVNTQNLSMARTVGEGAVLARAKQMGWPGAQTEDELRKFRTRFHMSVLDRMTDNEQPTLAKQYLDANAPEIDGETRAKSNIDKIIEASGLKQRAQNEADKIAEASPDDFTTWVAKANKIPDADLRDAVVQRISQRYSLEEKARDDVEKQTLGRVFQGVLDKRYLDRTSKDFQSLTDEGKARAIDKLDSLNRQQKADDAEARRQQQEFDRRALAYFDSLDDKTKAGSTFSANDNKVYDGISDVARYQLEARKNRAGKDIQQKQVANKADFDAIVGTATANLGKKEKEQVKSFMTDWRIRWYDEHDQRPPTRDEVRDTGLTEAVKTYVIPGMIWDSTKKGYQLSQEDREKYQSKQATPTSTGPATPASTRPDIPRTPAPKNLDEPVPSEVMRRDPKTNRTAIYDATNKRFLRWQK